MQYTIKNENISVTADAFGAELISVKHNGKEWVWQNTNGAWGGHGPLLFPVCGHCGVTVNGVAYPIKSHGFASRMEFSLVEKTETSVKFALEANAETKKVYPYDFRFTVTYALAGNTLSIGFDMENLADTPLYFACGGHESFNVDSGDLSNYELRFEKTEKLVSLIHNNGGYLTGETVDFGETDTLVLPDDFMQEGKTLIFKEVNSRKVTLAKKDGEAVLDVTFDGFCNLLLWRASNSPYVCIEPWTNLPDEADVPDIEYSQKFGVMKVEGKGKKSLVRTLTYHG